MPVWPDLSPQNEFGMILHSFVISICPISDTSHPLTSFLAIVPHNGSMRLLFPSISVTPNNRRLSIIIIIIIIISIFKEDNVFSITASLPYGPPVNTDIDNYRTFFRTC